MKNYKKYPFKITLQGPVKVNHTHILKKTKDVILVLVDLDEKRACIEAIGSDSLTNIVYVVPSVEDNRMTAITFENPEFDLWNYHISRYTLFLTFLRKDKEHEG